MTRTSRAPLLRAPRTCLAPLAEPARAGLAVRLAVLTYGVLCYVLTLAVFAYLAGFMGNLLTPTQLDAPASGPLGVALAVDFALLAVFAVQHSVMARPWWKRRWLPQPVERATYLLASCLALITLLALWRPIGGVVWNLEAPLARGVVLGVYAAGWALLLAATFLINHFDLFGLRQVWLFARGRPCPPLPFRTPAFYRIVRHPLYVGWLMVFWATPTMTVAHLLFAAGMTAYILAAIRWEERDLVVAHPEYAAYRDRLPKLIPRLGRRRAAG
jgi:methanethiol S-methyltransferase